MNNVVGVAAVLGGRAAAVVDGLRQLSQRAAQNVGAAHPVTGDARGVYAMALAAMGSRQAGAEFEAALPGLLAARQQLGEAEESLRVRIRQWILEAYLHYLSETSASDSDAPAKGFVIADMLRGGNTQQAVAASAARAGAKDPALAAAVRKEQDLRTEMVASFRALQRLATMSPDQLAEQKENPAVLRSRIAAISIEHKQLFADIERRFPKYANLINPQPPSLQQTREVIRDGEVLVSVVTTASRSYVWAVPYRGDVVFHSTGLGEDAIAPIVKQLRAALDVGDMAPSQWPMLDLAGAYRIYSALFGPARHLLAGAHTLMVAAGNSLSALPPAVLVTDVYHLPPDKLLPFDRYTDVPWLGNMLATAQLPSVNTLVLLRSANRGAPNRAAFVGFADPVFAASAAASPTTRSVLRGAPGGRVTEQALRSTTNQAWLPYSRLTPLPDTRDEVVAMAMALGADPVKDVVLGAQVTRQRVMQMDLSATRVVAFATHGLLPGDFPGLSQPALALSAPAGIDADRQPLQALLTLEDVLQLKLDADWVVLSACNTAATDGQGGEAVSGLGRGFFYVGTRALLVTHWSVDSESAKDLVSGVFRAYSADPSLTRARALHQAMAHLRKSAAKDAAGNPGYSLAHPLFWAPYALFGEPGR